MLPTLKMLRSELRWLGEPVTKARVTLAVTVAHFDRKEHLTTVLFARSRWPPRIIVHEGVHVAMEFARRIQLPLGLLELPDVVVKRNGRPIDQPEEALAQMVDTFCNQVWARIKKEQDRGRL